MRYSLFVFLVCVYHSAAAQSDRELFHLDYSLAPVNTSGTHSILHTTNLHFRFPILMKENYTLASGLGYETMWTSNYPLFGDQGVHGLNKQFFFLLNLKNERSILAFASAGIYSDFKDISGEDFRYTTGIRYKFKIHHQFTLSYGLGVSRQFFGTMVAPFIDFDWKLNDRWQLAGPFPINTRLRYALAPNVELTFFLKPDNNTFRLSEGAHNSQYFQKKQWNLGLSFDYMLTRHWQLTLRGGHAFRRKFEIFDVSQTGILSILTFDVRGGKRTPSYHYEEKAFFGEMALAWLIPGSK